MIASTQIHRKKGIKQRDISESCREKYFRKCVLEKTADDEARPKASFPRLKATHWGTVQFTIPLTFHIKKSIHNLIYIVRQKFCEFWEYLFRQITVHKDNAVLNISTSSTFQQERFLESIQFCYNQLSNVTKNHCSEWKTWPLNRISEL